MFAQAMRGPLSCILLVQLSLATLFVNVPDEVSVCNVNQCQRTISSSESKVSCESYPSHENQPKTRHRIPRHDALDVAKAKTAPMVLRAFAPAGEISQLLSEIEDCIWKPSHHAGALDCSLSTNSSLNKYQGASAGLASRLMALVIPTHCGAIAGSDMVPVRRFLPGAPDTAHVDSGPSWTLLLHLSYGVTKLHAMGLSASDIEVRHSPGDVMVWWNDGTSPLHSGTGYNASDKMMVNLGVAVSPSANCDGFSARAAGGGPWVIDVFVVAPLYCCCCLGGTIAGMILARTLAGQASHDSVTKAWEGIAGAGIGAVSLCIVACLMNCCFYGDNHLFLNTRPSLPKFCQYIGNCFWCMACWPCFLLSGAWRVFDERSDGNESSSEAEELDDDASSA